MNEIDIFYTSSSKSKNDSWNKKRETITMNIINGDIEDSLVERDDRWRHLIEETNRFVQMIPGCPYVSVRCCKKAGRTFNHDLQLVYTFADGNVSSYNVEYKYGTHCIEDAPQFVSPCHPDQYMSVSHSELYYDSYLP